MWTCSLGNVGESVEHGAVAGNLEGRHGGGKGLVGGRVGCDGGGKLLGAKREMERDEQKRGGSKNLVETHGLIVVGAARVVKERSMMKVRR